MERIRDECTNATDFLYHGARLATDKRLLHLIALLSEVEKDKSKDWQTIIPSVPSSSRLTFTAPSPPSRPI